MEVVIIGIVLYLLTRKKEEIKRDPATGNIVRQVIDPKTGKAVFVKGSKPVANVNKYKSASN